MSTQLGNKKIMAKNIQYYMDLYNKTRNDICQDLGIKYTTFTDWIKANTYPRIDKIELMANYFNIEKSDLIEEHNKESVQSDRPLPSNIMVPAGRQIPILGTICAGNGIHCEENFEGYFLVDRSIKADYCLRVKGDSMIDANIYDGDVAFLRKDFDFIDGEIYAVCYGAEESASLKKLYKVDNKMMLQPCNADYNAAFVDVDDVLIVGECIGTYHAR